jgi:hypothetical protein
VPVPARSLFHGAEAQPPRTGTANCCGLAYSLKQPLMEDYAATAQFHPMQGRFWQATIYVMLSHAVSAHIYAQPQDPAVLEGCRVLLASTGCVQTPATALCKAWLLGPGPLISPQ